MPGNDAETVRLSVELFSQDVPRVLGAIGELGLSYFNVTYPDHAATPLPLPEVPARPRLNPDRVTSLHDEAGTMLITRANLVAFAREQQGGAPKTTNVPGTFWTFLNRYRSDFEHFLYLDESGELLGIRPETAGQFVSHLRNNPTNHVAGPKTITLLETYCADLFLPDER